MSDDFQSLVRAELTRARIAHPKPINSAHEGYSVLLEEVEEFWLEVKKKQRLRSPERMLEELVQVAAMAQCVAEDIGLIVEEG